MSFDILAVALMASLLLDWSDMLESTTSVASDSNSLSEFFLEHDIKSSNINSTLNISPLAVCLL